MADIVVIGAGGHAVSVANVVCSTDHTLKGFVDRQKAGHKLLGLDIHADEASFYGEDVLFCIAIGANSTRESVARRIVSEIGIERFPSIVHSSAEIGIFSRLGFGTVVMPNATVGPNCTIGDFCIVNTNASIDHDSRMDDFSSLAPGVNAGGNVAVGRRSAISIGATLRHGISVGSDTVIGAASYVNGDIADDCVAYGSPAAIVRGREPGDGYL